MRFLTAILLGLLSLVAPVAAQAQGTVTQAQSDPVAAWSGTYAYDHAGGRTVGGTGIVVTYSLHIPPAQEGRPATLEVTGFQTDQAILCDVLGTRDVLQVRFRSYADGSTLNQYGVAEYAPGATLFTLRMDRSRGSPRLITSWEAMYPGQPTPRTGSLFRKTD